MIPSLALQTIGALSLALPILAQTSSWVVPDLTATRGIANGSSGQPWFMTTNSVRMQQMYGPGEFPYRTPMTITRIRFRPRDFTPSTVSWTGGTYQMDIKMSTGATTPSTMSTTYAQNEGNDVVLVHSGPVQLLSGSGNAPGPSLPYVDLALTTPFTYDPAQGPLLVEFASDGALFSGGSAYFPAVALFGTHDVARVWTFGSHTATSGNYQAASGLVMEFDFLFNGTHVDFFVDRTAAATGSALQFTDRSITSATGGIQGWAWDLDGDGVVDSTAQHPTFAYTAPGTYPVSLTVTAATPGSPVTKTRAGYITIADPAGSVPDLVQYQCNDVRGAAVANSATGSVFPANGTAINANWQGDPGISRAAFGPNEVGFGCIASSGNADDNWIDTGAPLSIQGSLTIAWWQRMDPAAPANAFAYAWGGPGSNFTCYNRGGAYSSILFQGEPATGDLLCTKDLHHPNWVHLCLVIDDAAGTVRWFVDGEPAGAKNYPPNTHSVANTLFYVGKHDASTTHAQYYAMDDFRLYGRALSYGEVLGLLAEGASAARFGSGCATVGSEPQIAAQGRPTVGNLSFALRHDNPSYGNGLVAFVAGWRASAGLPIPLSPFLGCGELLVSPDLSTFALTDGSGVAVHALGIPAISSLVGTHLYAQYLTGLGVTAAIDCNIQLR